MKRIFRVVVAISLSLLVFLGIPNLHKARAESNSASPSTAVLPGPVPDAAPAPLGPVLGVVDRKNKSEFESQVLPVIQSELSACGACVVRNYTHYNDDGKFKSDDLLSQLELAGKESQVLLINFNEKLNAKNKDLLQTLNQLSAKGILIVATAGQPGPNENSAPLAQTLMGQVSNALIIGELGEKDRLIGASYFGPEMLTALRPPKDLIGQGNAPVIFAARLIKNLKKKKDWVVDLRSKKTNTRKIWLDLYDCFGR